MHVLVLSSYQLGRLEVDEALTYIRSTPSIRVLFLPSIPLDWALTRCFTAVVSKEQLCLIGLTA
jgi:hypothetical protein